MQRVVLVSCRNVRGELVRLALTLTEPRCLASILKAIGRRLF